MVTDTTVVAKRALQRARELIEHGWTQGASARNDDHAAVSHRSPDATCFCASGAIQRAAFEAEPENLSLRLEMTELALNTLERALIDSRGVLDVVAFNDNINTKQQDVLELFDRALAA